MIELENISLSFGGLAALRGVSLSVEEAAGGGGIFGLIGPNGAGKTTLLNTLTGFVRPDSGTIRIGGVDVTRAPVHRRARFGVVRSFQTVRLLEDESLLTNMLLGAYRFHRGRALGEILGLDRRSRREQEESIAQVTELLGFEATDLSRPVSTLPFGMRRMAELGRVLVTRPRLALLDEPAAGLAEDQRTQLGRVLRRFSDELGVMVVMTEHDIDFVRGLCGEIAVLDTGQLIARGSPAETLTDPRVQSAYFGTETEDEHA